MAWLLSRALKPLEAAEDAAGSATTGARDQGRRLRAAVVDASPVGGDSVETRMRRAQEAGDRAREAEARAVEAAQDSQERSDHARQVGERGRAELRELDRDLGGLVKRRVAEAQKAAEESVQRERRAAEADAEERRGAAEAQVAADTEDAQEKAEASRRRAEELVGDATEQLAEARRLAGEAAAAARSAAEEASRQARQLAGEAEEQAHAADAQVAATEELQGRTQTTARDTARALQHENGGLETYNKPELVQLAESIGIERRTTMTKGELVDAIAKASRATRSTKGTA